MIDALAVMTDEARQGIDARQLHSALGIGRDFPTWIADVIERFDLAEGVDFSPVSGKSTGGRPAVEYALAISTAKLVAISTRGPEALKAREALIKIEEAWNSPTAVMARAVVFAHAENERLRAAAALNLPKIEAFDRFLGAGGDVSIRKASKTLGIPEKQLVSRLLGDAVLFRDARGRLEAYAKHVTEGRFRLRAVPIGDEAEDVTTQTLVTPKGLDWLARRYRGGGVALLGAGAGH